MKKLLFLLLLPIFCLGQVSNGTETEFEALKVTSPQTVTNPTNLTTTGADGTQGKVLASEFAKTTTTVNINGDVQSLASNRTWRTAQADTGVLSIGGITIASGTQVNIGAVTGYIVDNETNPSIPTWTYINYAGETNKTVTTLGSGITTYVLLNSSGTIVFQNTFPTSAQRKSMIYLSKIGHPTGTITVVGDEPDFITSPLAQFRDLFQAFNYINQGIYAYPNGVNLSFNATGGSVIGDGINFKISRTNPNTLAVSPTVPTAFLKRTQTGLGGTSTTFIDPANYDVSGTITAIGGGVSRSTIQYIWYVPGLGEIVTYGQTVYANLNDAVSAIGKENPVIYPALIHNSILIGALALRRDATDLSNTAQAIFFRADILGQLVGASAGVSTATLQTAYNNSLVPQITVSDALGALTVKNGRALDTSSIISGQNIARTETFRVKGNGDTTINGFIDGTATRVLPAGNTFIGQLFNLTGVDNTSRLINRTTINHNEDGIVSTSLTNNEYFLVNNKSTNQPGSTTVVSNISFNQNGTGSLGNVLINRASLGGTGTGNISNLQAFGIASAPIANTYSITNFFGLDLSYSPQNNVTNARGIAIGELYGSTLSRGIESLVSAGAGKYNIYAGGTADNYFNGVVRIRTTTASGADLTVGGSISASSAIARGVYINNTLVATANNDALVGLDINPTFTNGAFTGTTNLGVRSTGTIRSQVSTGGIIDIKGFGVQSGVINTPAGGSLQLQTNSVEALEIFGATGNIVMQTGGGTFVDAGFKVDIQGTTRLGNTVTIQTAPTTSAGTFTFNTRNTSTGVIESIPSANVAFVASPTFTGDPKAPTATAGDNDTSIATTAFVSAAVSSGSYTPVLTAGLNMSSLVLSSATFMRVGNIVHATVSVGFSITASNSVTSFTVSLPINKTTTSVLGVGEGTSGTSSYKVATLVRTSGDTSTVAATFDAALGTGPGGTSTLSFQYSILD